jgi:hypothetical protein
MLVGVAVGYDVSHRLSLHTPLTQSVHVKQLLPAAHAGQLGPPQSVSVSSPSNIPSTHEDGVGIAVGAKVGAPSDFVRNAILFS